MIGNLTQKTPEIINRPYLIKPNQISNKPAICNKDEISLTRTSCVCKNLNFTSKPLYEVNNLKDSKGKPIPAKITLLNNSVKKDIEAVNKLKKNWKDAEYISQISKEFQNTKTKSKPVTLALELNELNELKDPKNTLPERIKCIALLSPNGLDLKLHFLQTDPDTKFGQSKRAILGAGKLLMYGACRYAIENYNCLYLSSTNNPFYKKIGIIEENGESESDIDSENDSDSDDDDYIYLYKKKLLKFIKKIEDEYNFKEEDRYKGNQKGQ